MSVTSCLLLLSVLAWAAREDLLRHRIPNELNLAAMLAAIGLAYSSGGTHGVASSVAGAAVGCAAFAPFYLLRGMGAGDVKLMAAAGAFLGPADALAAAALAIVMGGALAVAVVMLRLVESTPVRGFSFRDGSAPVLRLFATISAARKERFPYATAIAAGVVTTLALQGSLGQFYSFWAFE